MICSACGFASTIVHVEDTPGAGCSNSSLNVAYAFTSSGFVQPSSHVLAPLVGAFASLGNAFYDGATVLVRTRSVW
jgi:hypothetical protein